MSNRFLSLCAAALLVFSANNASAVVLTLTPDSATVTAGVTTFDVAVEVSGLGAGVAPSIGAFNLDVLFDTALLSLTNTAFGDQLGFVFGSFSGVNTIAAGVNLNEISLDSPATLDTMQADSFTLVTLSFAALTSGEAVLELANVVLGDVFGDPLQFSISNNITTVPQPGTLLLLAMGLIGFALKKSRHAV